MSKMSYTMIKGEVHMDPMVRSLGENFRARLAYLVIISSPSTPYNGYFYYPYELLKAHSGIDENSIPSAIALLSEAGLIEYDASTDFVRVVGWFYKFYMPDNADHLSKVIKDFLRDPLPRNAMSARCVAEFFVGALVRAKAFKRDRKNTANFYAHLQIGVADAEILYPDLLDVIQQEIATFAPEVRKDFALLCPETGALELTKCKGEHFDGTVYPPCPDPVCTVGTQEDEIEINKQKEAGSSSEGLSASTNVTQIRPQSSTLNSEIARMARMK